MIRSARSVGTGPGSRGGTIHLPGRRALYQRDWRKTHPEYRARETDAKVRRRAIKRGADPDLALADVREQREARQVSSRACACECGCKARVATVCGLCRDDLHEDVE